MEKALTPRLAATKPMHTSLQAVAVMLVLLGLSINTQLDDAQPNAGIVPLPQQIHTATNNSNNIIVPVQSSAIHVLSPKDAELYTAVFVAQEKSDWKTADAALAQVKDRRLVGHVLADRYARQPADLAEAKQWMESYADLPEADNVYDAARKIKGFAASKIARPASTPELTGNGNGLGSMSGFRSASDGDTAHSKALVKINAALRNGDPIMARDILNADLQRGTLTVNNSGDIISRIAASFYYQGEFERARPLAHMAAQSGVPLGLWIDGLSAWRQHDFTASTRSFASLAQSPILGAWDHAAASYWAYRAAKKAGDETQSRHWLAEAAKNPNSFYGTMAASAEGHSQRHSWKMPELNEKNMAILSQSPAGWQALALAQIGHNDAAEDELRRINANGNHAVQNAALALAEKAQLPSLTMQLGGMATNDNGQHYQAAQYPLPPWQPVGGFKVDRALIYALMRHESQFDPDAVSGSGACGLMQIMPSTARGMDGAAAQHGRAQKSCPKALFDPATNLEMGQRYVRTLAGQPMIGDNLLLLLAAYNGGPGNLAKWLDGEDRSDPLLFIESLPMRETHDYVQQVMMQYWMYRDRLAEPENSASQLAQGKWPRYALNDAGQNSGGVRHAGAISGIKVASRY